MHVQHQTPVIVYFLTPQVQNLSHCALFQATEGYGLKHCSFLVCARLHHLILRYLTTDFIVAQRTELLSFRSHAFLSLTKLLSQCYRLPAVRRYYYQIRFEFVNRLGDSPIRDYCFKIGRERNL